MTDLQMSQIAQTPKGIFRDCFNLVPFNESVQWKVKQWFNILCQICLCAHKYVETGGIHISISVIFSFCTMVEKDGLGYGYIGNSIIVIKSNVC